MSTTKTSSSDAKAQSLKDTLDKQQAQVVEAVAALDEGMRTAAQLKATADKAAQDWRAQKDAVAKEVAALESHKAAVKKAEASKAKDKDTKLTSAQKAVEESQILLQGLRDNEAKLQDAADKAADDLVRIGAAVTNLATVKGNADAAVADTRQKLDALQQPGVAAPTEDTATTLARLNSMCTKLQEDMARSTQQVSEALETSGLSLSSSIPEVEKSDVSSLTAEKKQMFTRHRPISRNSSGKVVFGSEGFRAFVKSRCEALRLGLSQWMLPILIVITTDVHHKQVFDLLVSWAESHAVGAPLPIVPGMTAVVSMIHLLGAMYSRHVMAASGSSWRLLDLSLDAHLRSVDPVIIIMHQGDLKDITGRHPMKASMEGMGYPFPEQAPANMMAALMSGAVGGLGTPQVVAPPPPPPPPAASTPATTPAPVAPASSDVTTAMALQLSDLMKTVRQLNNTVSQMSHASKRSRELDARDSKLKHPELECDTCQGKGHVKANCVPTAQATCKGRCMRCGGNKHAMAVCPSPLK